MMLDVFRRLDMGGAMVDGGAPRRAEQNEGERELEGERCDALDKLEAGEWWVWGSCAKQPPSVTAAATWRV